MQLYHDYDEIRSLYFKNETKINILYDFIIKQERTNLELRTFMFESLDKVFKAIEDNETDVMQYIVQTMPE